MRLVDFDNLGEIIQVELRQALPVRVLWRDLAFRVTRVESIWCVEGQWWSDKKLRGIQRRYYRLSLTSSCGGQHCFEIYRQGPTWRIWRIAD